MQNYENSGYEDMWLRCKSNNNKLLNIWWKNYIWLYFKTPINQIWISFTADFSEKVLNILIGLIVISKVSKINNSIPY